MKKYLLLLSMLCRALCSQAQHQNALDFDGIDDEVTVPGASSLIAGSNQMSITCWVYPTNAAPVYPDFDGFAGFRNEVDCDFYVMQVSPATAIEARFRNSAGGVYTITNQGLNLNVWQHLALTFDGTMLRLYVGGVVADSVAASGGITNISEPFHMGTLPYSTNPYWLTGKLDEISLWNRALTPAEVACIAQESIDPFDIACRLYYSCNQGDANGVNTGITTLTDGSSHMDGLFNNLAMNGTFSNFVPGINNAAAFAHTICQGDSYQFGNSTYSEPGFYYESFPLNGACGNLQELNLFVIAVDTSVTLAGETLSANAAGAAYQWIDCNNGFAVIPGATNQIFSPLSDGSYALIITQGSCTDTSSCYAVTNVGIAENEFQSAIYLFPSPVSDLLTVKNNLPAGDQAVLYVHDALGREIFRTVSQNSSVLEIDVAKWPAGMYFLVAGSGRHQAHYKLMKTAAR